MTSGGAGVATTLRAARARLAAGLAEAVASWPKYAEAHAADPEAFARLETEALVDYLAAYAATGDENYRHLYIGEKAKQFHDPATPPEVRQGRERALLARERVLFAEAAGAAGAGFVARAFDAIELALTAPAAAEARVLFVGDCLYLDVVAFLTAPLLADDVRLVSSFVTSHDALERRAELGRLADERFDLIVYSPFTYALDQRWADLQRPRSLARRGRLAAAIADAGDAAEATLDTLADLFDCPILVHAPAPIVRHEGTLRDRARALLTGPDRRRAARRLGRRVRAAAARRVDGGARIRVVDEAALVAPVGLAAAGRYFHKAALQHPARFGALVAAHYRDPIVAVARLLKRKLVVCDLDNTLWEGVIGEGLGVRHHADRQRILLDLKARGVVLAINSKNDPAKVSWEGADALLSAADFVSSQINWDPKPLNVRRIAQHLNLKPKDFVFVDDRADERAMVAEQFAGLHALDALDPRSWRLMALWAELLPANPDADRTAFYRQRDARQAFLAAEEESGEAQRAALYADLGLTLAIREAAPADLARVTELINRTNQFNMTGGRITQRQTEAYAASPQARILVADAADRFGAMGTIAVLIAAREDQAVTIPFFVLSCRVFGYGMERAVLEAARALAPAGAALFGPFAETPFNQPCRDVYPRAGFAPVDGGWRLEAASDRAIDAPAWLTVSAEVARLPSPASHALG